MTKKKYHPRGWSGRESGTINKNEFARLRRPRPTFQKFQRRAKQTEGKGYLASIYTAEKSYQAEWSTYTSSLPGIGFAPEGKGSYRAGFTQAAAAGTAYGNNSVTAGDVTSLAPAIAAGGVAIPAQGSLPTTVMTVGAPGAFTAGTVGAIGGAANDQWTMDEQKVLRQITDGTR